jgi:hypothetical protein
MRLLPVILLWDDYDDRTSLESLEVCNSLLNTKHMPYLLAIGAETLFIALPNNIQLRATAEHPSMNASC